MNGKLQKEHRKRKRRIAWRLRRRDWDEQEKPMLAAKNIRCRSRSISRRVRSRSSVGAITSSRCTNEEVYLLQKLVRQFPRQPAV